MDFDFSEEQEMLREQARRLLGDLSSPDTLRGAIRNGESFSTDLWTALAELGLLGAAVPEKYGGVGLSETDLCVIVEELGRFVAPVPFFSSICLAAEAIRLAGKEEQKARWLPGLAAGEVVGTFALHEGGGEIDVHNLEAHFSDGRLNGVKCPVPDGTLAQLVVVLAHSEGVPVLVLAHLDGDGVSVSKLDTIDQLRSHARISFHDAAAEQLGEGPAGPVFEKLMQRAAVLCAFEQIGGAEAALYMGRDHVMERKIFGRVLGSYQAIKHKLADMFVAIELARSNAYYACWAMENDSPDLPNAAYSARLSGIKAYELAAQENLQMHGGIGYTFEANCHFHYRRSRLLALNLGSQEQCSDQLVSALARSHQKEATA